MPQTWTFTNETTTVDFTDDVQSANVVKGRATQDDQYAPGGLTFTIRNQSDQASGFTLNDKIELSTNGFSQFFWVKEILFNDTSGKALASTATIACNDLLGLMGRINVIDDALTQAATLSQIYTEFNSLLPAGSDFVLSGNGDSIAIGDTYTGSILNRLNENLVTEQGWLGLAGGDCGLISRSFINDLLPPVITFARESSGSYQFGYSNIERIQLGVNFVNTSTVIPPIATAQTAVDAASVALYTTYGQTVSTVDYNGTQALGLAEWIAASRSDPTILQFVITLDDLSQNLLQLMVSIEDQLPVVNVKFRIPGDVTDTESLQIVQGLQFQITNVGTFYTVTTSPFSYYAFEIEYNQTDMVYNEPIAYNESRNW
tara:strand:- start:1496 stop:2614 length:1119 start_codon:yes stop_codon:yes gene_type:complete